MIRNLRNDRFAPVVILQRREGEFLRLLDGVSVVALRQRRAPLCIAELAWHLRRQRIDTVYSATTATNIYAALAAKAVGCRAIISEHTPLAGNLAESKWRRLREAGIRAAYPLADLAVAPLPLIGTELGELLGRRSPQFLALPNPVVERIDPASAVPDRATRFVSVGRLAEVKRFDLMIEAFAQMLPLVPEATLTIYGEGPERAGLETRIERLGLQDKVRLPGFAADVSEQLRTGELFICTSRREGFGNAIVEAMAAGLPVVSFDCPVGPEVLLNGGAAGCLVRDHSAPALANALAEVALDPVRRTAYAAAGREVAAAFTVTSAVTAHERAFTAASG